MNILHQKEGGKILLCWCSRGGSHGAVKREVEGLLGWSSPNQANQRCPRNGKWTKDVNFFNIFPLSLQPLKPHGFGKAMKVVPPARIPANIAANLKISLIAHASGEAGAGHFCYEINLNENSSI